jgi:hypothetical protein
MSIRDFRNYPELFRTVNWSCLASIHKVCRIEREKEKKEKKERKKEINKRRKTVASL